MPAIIILAFGFLAFVTAAILLAEALRLRKEKVTARLAPLQLYWESFHLFSLPHGERERSAFFFNRGQQAGLSRGMFVSDGLVAIALGAGLLIRWISYPSAKKSALKSLAEEKSLSDQELKFLAEKLR